MTRHIKDVLEFRNGSSLEVSTNSAALVRGRSAIAVLGSEVSFWKTAEYSASSDEEVISSAEPSMSMCPDGGLLIMGSSVYRKRGLMFRMYKELWANNDSEDLVWFAPSTVMNPKLPTHIVERALASNPQKARAEYLNQWRDDLTDFVPEDVITAATDFGVHERGPIPHVQYHGFADAAGGTGQDSFCLAISHKDGTSCVVDVLREYKPRFTPANVIAELAALVKRYGISRVFGDRYAVGFHSAEWANYNIKFEPCETSTSENYLMILPMLLAGRVRLIDSKTLRNQLGSLERRPSDSGRETVSHPQHDGAHDDVSCACAGAIVAAQGPRDGSYSLDVWRRAFGTPGDDDPPESLLKRSLQIDARFR